MINMLPELPASAPQTSQTTLGTTPAKPACDEASILDTTSSTVETSENPSFQGILQNMDANNTPANFSPQMANIANSLSENLIENPESTLPAEIPTDASINAEQLTENLNAMTKKQLQTEHFNDKDRSDTDKQENSPVVSQLVAALNSSPIHPYLQMVADSLDSTSSNLDPDFLDLAEQKILTPDSTSKNLSLATPTHALIDDSTINSANMTEDQNQPSGLILPDYLSSNHRASFYGQRDSEPSTILSATASLENLQNGNNLNSMPDFASQLQTMNSIKSPSDFIQTLQSNDPAATFQLNSPFGSSAWSSEFSDKILMLAKQEGHSAKLMLSPPELGAVLARLDIQNNQANLQLFAADPSVHKALQNNLQQLQHLFQDNNLSLINVSVSQDASQFNLSNQNASQSNSNQENNYGDSNQQTNAKQNEIGIEPARVIRSSDGLIDAYV